MKPIVVVGSINIDFVVSTGLLPQPGETLHGDSFEVFSGGKGANQAAAVARLGAPVILLGALGDDAYAGKLRADLKAAGVDTSQIETIPGPSGTALITRSARGENTIVVVAGANAGVTLDRLERHRDLLRSASMVLTQLEIPLQTVEWLAETLETAGVPLMLDPAPAQALPVELLRRVSWLTPNETEAAVLLGGAATSEADATGTAERLLTFGARNLLLKLGERGAYMTGKDCPAMALAPVTVGVVDTTAAGDVFNSAFAVALGEGRGAADAGHFAARAAAISVTRRGAQVSLPTRAEVETSLSI